MSVNNTDPSKLFGGSWEQLKDKFLLGAGSTYTAGNTGGEATHKLTIREIPSHTHKLGVRGSSISGGAAVFTTMPDLNMSGNTMSKGHDEAHNNMPPYLVVYMWKRTA